MLCPICETNVRDADLECAGCGESLPPWNTMRKSGEALRQRGLNALYRKDHLGAMVSFLEAALTNPLDEKSGIDAARLLIMYGKIDDAERILGHLAGRAGSRAEAAALGQAIKEQIRPAMQREAAKQRQAAAAREKAAMAAAKPPASPVPTPEAEEKPAAAEAPPAAASPPPAPIANQGGPKRRLLALGTCVVGRKTFRRPPTPLWLRILQKETQTDANWAGIPEVFAEIAATFRENRAETHYMLGLGFWQAGLLDEAERAFRVCLEQKPQVLNPYAYWIAVHLTGGDKVRGAIAELARKHLSEDDVRHCVDALHKRLQRGDEPAMLEALSQLR